LNAKSIYPMKPRGSEPMLERLSEPLQLPQMMMIRQIFDVPAAIDVEAAVDAEFSDLRKGLKLAPGARVAVCVGSRGLANLDRVVGRVVSILKAWGASPFIMPAMGSHGGATAEGQISVLKHRGITEETAGAPVRATMDVVHMGQTGDGIPIFLNRLAHEADALCLVNRIKPHTNFIGATESGLVKMMAIGLGNQTGAEHYHRLSLTRDQYSIISSAGRELIKRRQPVIGVALVENQDHRTCGLQVALNEQIEPMETGLLRRARELLPGLPMDQIDLLIVDEMGKDISGEGLDPNVVGRDCCSYGARRERPRITRIFVRDLTEATEGSALGIGLADFALRRLVNKIDPQATYVNCLTSCCPEAARIPMTFDTDREALAAALLSIRPYEPGDLGLVYIENTLDLTEIMVSEAYRSQLEADPALEILADHQRLALGSDGMLLSPFLKENTPESR
jgi:hypothetical protein